MTGIVVLGTLSLFTLLVTVLEPSNFAELSVDLLKGRLSVKKATPENVEETLKAVADQNVIERNDGGQSVETLRALVASVEHKDTSARTDADYLALATDAWRAKNNDDAMRYVYVGLDRPASDTRITAALYSRLGSIEVDLGLNVQAERHYLRAIDIDPRFEWAHNNLGVLQFNLERSDEAEASYREAIRLNPEYIDAHNNLGLLLKKLGKNKEAEEMFARAKELKQTQK